MKSSIKNQSSILAKLGIDQLNDMQLEAAKVIQSNKDLILLSPTGTGKTLAFLLPIIKSLDAQSTYVQALIIAPSRELAIQIHTVGREMGSGYKMNVVYGGRPISKDFMDLERNPAILIGTPGRIADHLSRETFDASKVRVLVLDEFDKSLEIGFEEDMRDITDELPNVDQYVLTSATEALTIPDYIHLKTPSELNYLLESNKGLVVKRVLSPDKDKLKTLVNLIKHR